MATEQQQKKFDKLLEPEWQEQMLGEKDNKVVDEEIRQAAMNLVTLEIAQKLDEDLANLKEQVKVAQEQYTTGKKENLCKIEFLVEMLRDRGVAVPSVGDFVKQAKKPETAEEIARDAAAKLAKSLSKEAAGPGGSVTISTPGGRSATIKGE
jgi:hypothetical protein